jgi:hypothetical protein
VRTGVMVGDGVMPRSVRRGKVFEQTAQRVLQDVDLGVVGDSQRLPAERKLATWLLAGRVALRGRSVPCRTWGESCPVTGAPHVTRPAMASGASCLQCAG